MNLPAFKTAWVKNCERFELSKKKGRLYPFVRNMRGWSVDNHVVLYQVFKGIFIHHIHTYLVDGLSQLQNIGQMSKASLFGWKII